MNSILVGYTGFVGQNLCNGNLKDNFSAFYNSKNIQQAFGSCPDILYYCGVPAEKFLANTAPEKDKLVIENAISNIQKIGPRRVVLISTADIYKTPNNVDENTVIDTENLHPYGLNRYYLEKWVSENYTDYLIVRLPGLFGKGIKKNFLFDMLTIIPSMLTTEKYKALSAQSGLVKNCYAEHNEKFYKLVSLDDKTKASLKAFFENNSFNALSFTDQKAIYQFYNLENLYNDIQIALKNNIKILNMTSEGVSASEIYSYIKNTTFENNITDTPILYNIKSIHAGLYNGENGYMVLKDDILAQIKDFYLKNL